jgi:hypothetical protein
LKNKDLIAMNQDKLGIGAPVVQRDGDVYVFAKDMKKLQGLMRAVVVTNLSDESKTMSVSMDALGFTGQVKVYDCFAHQNAGSATGTFSVTVPAHGSAAYYMTGKRIEKKVFQAEEAWLKAYQEIKDWHTGVFQETPAADQGAYVGSIGNGADNYLEWRNVYSYKGGEYNVSIRYASGEPRDMSMTVNGGQSKQFTGLNSGDYLNQWDNVNVKVTLKKGYNTIRLSNATAWMPNIDCMTIEPVK